MLIIDEEKTRLIISARMRATRLRQPKKQYQISQEAGITQAQLSNYERGKSIPSLATAVDLADLYGVSLDYITGRTDNPFSHKVPRAPMKYKQEEDQ